MRYPYVPIKTPDNIPNITETVEIDSAFLICTREDLKRDKVPSKHRGD